MGDVSNAAPAGAPPLLDVLGAGAGAPRPPPIRVNGKGQTIVRIKRPPPPPAADAGLQLQALLDAAASAPAAPRHVLLEARTREGTDR